MNTKTNSPRPPRKRFHVSQVDGQTFQVIDRVRDAEYAVVSAIDGENLRWVRSPTRARKDAYALARRLNAAEMPA